MIMPPVIAVERTCGVRGLGGTRCPIAGDGKPGKVGSGELPLAIGTIPLTRIFFPSAHFNRRSSTHPIESVRRLSDQSTQVSRGIVLFGVNQCLILQGDPN